MSVDIGFGLISRKVNFLPLNGQKNTFLWIFYYKHNHLKESFVCSGLYNMSFKKTFKKICLRCQEIILGPVENLKKSIFCKKISQTTIQRQPDLSMNSFRLTLDFFSRSIAMKPLSKISSHLFVQKYPYSSKIAEQQVKCWKIRFVCDTEPSYDWKS